MFHTFLVVLKIATIQILNSWRWSIGYIKHDKTNRVPDPAGTIVFITAHTKVSLCRRDCLSGLTMFLPNHHSGHTGAPFHNRKNGTL